MVAFIQSVSNLLSAYGSSLLLGIRMTLLLAFTGTMAGFVIGLFIGGFKAVQLDYTASAGAVMLKKFFDFLADVYVTVFRGTPMMVQAVFIYYAFLHVFNWTSLTAALVVISINTGAYMSEMVRSGIQAVDIGQTEAARSLGMSNAQTMMFVVLPQAIRNAFPAIGNEFIVNIKDSSVLMIVSITELMFQAKSIAGSTFRFIETYFIIAMIYLLLTGVASALLNMIEKKLNGVRVSLPQSVTAPDQMQFARDRKQKGENSDYGE